MGVYTSIEFLNANDSAFVAARDGTPEQRQKWEEDEGPFDQVPGARVKCKPGEGYTETDEEYGGWIIPLDKIPEGTTHIHVYRG